MNSDFIKIIETLNAKKSGDSWIARCPGHNDSKPSLSLSFKNEKILFKCFAGCSQENIIANLKSRSLWGFAKAESKTREVESYDYCDETGNAVYQVVRYHPKKFMQRRLDRSASKWIYNLDGIKPIPFRLPQVIKAISNEETIFLVEGEKDVLNLERLGLTATCNSGGAGRWTSEHSKLLNGADVIIVPDNDIAGEKHALTVIETLKLYAKSIRVLEIPNLPEKGDVSDWIKQHKK